MAKSTVGAEDYKPGTIIDLGYDNPLRRFGIVISPEEYERLGGSKLFSLSALNNARQRDIDCPQDIIYYKIDDHRVDHVFVSSYSRNPKIITKCDVLKGLDKSLSELEGTAECIKANRKFFSNLA